MTCPANSTRRDDEMFSRDANGVRAINGSPASAPTPLALGLNVKTTHSWPGHEYKLLREVQRS